MWGKGRILPLQVRQRDASGASWLGSATSWVSVASRSWAPAATTFHPEHIGVRELTLHLKSRQREVIDLLYFGGYTQVQAV